MPRASRDPLSQLLAALADPTRRAIVEALGRGEASVAELAEPFRVSQPAISKHLKVLGEAGLISRSRDGQRRPCRLEHARLAELANWLKPRLTLAAGTRGTVKRAAKRRAGKSD